MIEQFPYFMPEQFRSEGNVDAEYFLESEFEPKGDQPKAIADLLHGLGANEKNQVLLGVTGSGKTFTMANLIAKSKCPALVLAPNKTLAAQLYAEMKAFFPKNAVEYFVSYYDYYQPEAYVPRTDTYIEKESTINEQIERMRHSATRALLERRDVIVVASVSCIYGIGAVETYSQMVLSLKPGLVMNQRELLQRLVEMQYKRNDIEFARGAFRVRGDTIEIFPSHMEDLAWRLSFFGDELESVIEFDSLTGKKIANLDYARLYANSHYVTPGPTLKQAITLIKEELKERLNELYAENKLVEAQRLEQRIAFDIEMIEATGFCSGIENYSRYLSGRKKGEAPPTLFEYLPKDALLFVDESHVMVPQLNAMYKGDRSRKFTLQEHGFRLPSCMDNRPLKFEEWDYMRPRTVFVSATPSAWELEQTDGVFAEQVIRPTGLIDPIVIIRPTENQIDDLIHECQQVIAANGRILITTLTKKMAEALTEYLVEANLKVSYIHSDVETLERIKIIQDLRAGVVDILVGINLLREGLDIPECALVAILDADKEGYLRSKTSLIQTFGRAARHLNGRVICYADVMTKSLEGAIEETNRRREKQVAYNTEHGITPSAIQKSIVRLEEWNEKHSALPSKEPVVRLTEKELEKQIQIVRKKMFLAAENLEFEEAAKLRDELHRLESYQISR